MDQASHPRSTARANTQCELIHTDVMSPKEDAYRLQTEGVSNVLTVMDDFSRYAEFAILFSKAQAAPVFQAMAKRMERQTAPKVQMVRYDRGKEYAGLKDAWRRDSGESNSSIHCTSEWTCGAVESDIT
jgi:IS30 family transposase